MAFAHPHVLLLAPVLVLAVGWLEARRRGGLGGRVLARSLLGLLLLGALAAPHGTRPVDRARRLVVAVDRSRGMGARARADAGRIAEAALREAQSHGAAVSLLGFAGRAAAPRACEGADLSACAGTWPAAADEDVPEPPEARRGSLAAALAAARLAFAPGEGGSVLMLTNGRGEGAGAAAAVEALEDGGIDVRAVAVPLAAPPPGPRTRLVSVEAPEEVAGPFHVRALVEAPRGARIVLSLDGRDLESREVPAGSDRPTGVQFEDLEAGPGLHEIAVRLEDEPAVADLERRILRVEAPPLVLASVGVPLASPTRRALTARGFHVVAVEPQDLAAALDSGAREPDALLLDAVAAGALDPAVAGRLVERVREGLGLFLEAGPSEDAWAALAATALAPLLPLEPLPPRPSPPEPAPAPPRPEPPVETPPREPGEGLSVERRPEEALPICLLLVLDRSGSMAGEKLAMAVEAARRAAATLSPFDRVGVVTFADEATLDVPPTPVERLGNLAWRLSTLSAGGNTDIFGALRRAAEALEADPAPIRHLLLLTDGRQTAREAVFGPLVRRMAAARITVTAVGLGLRHDEVLLKTIVQFAPRGRYVPADTAAQLPTILTRDTMQVAEERREAARALGRLPDPEREAPAPPEPEPAPEAAPEATPGPPATEPAPGPGLEPLVRGFPHEATHGLEQEALPRVGPPRRARLAPSAIPVLLRGEDEVVLAAGRAALGRVAVWALPPEDPGTAGWEALPQVLVQAVRAVLAPRGSLDARPRTRVLGTPDGERVRVEVPREAAPRTWRVLWEGGGATRDLGRVGPGEILEVAAPEAPSGSVARVRLVAEDGAPAPPGRSYVVRGAAEEASGAGDGAALEAVLGRPPSSAGGPFLGAGPRRLRSTPRWPLFLVAFLLLLPVDVALHRRGARS